MSPKDQQPRERSEPVVLPLTSAARPRRVLPADSVSLRRSKSKSPPFLADKVERADRAEEASVAGLSQVSHIAAASDDLQAYDAGAKSKLKEVEVPQEGDNAAEWFDDSNKNTLGKGNVRFVDHDLPFYLPRDKSSNETDTNQNTGSKSNPSPENQLPNLGDQYIPSAESWSDDYRSIIDDLTVENKELKQKLRKFEQMYSSHMQENKLFEVYIHRLSPAKKRKLEGMLREFASGVEPSDSQPYAHLMAPNQPNPSALKRAGSSNSTSKLQDSGYASISGSGGGASTQSQSNREISRFSGHPVQNTNQRVRSYVQDLPTSLLPKGSLIMSEKSKRKLVVQKLERLFLGRAEMVLSKQGQPQQQQEVSQSAASADRKEHEAKGRRVPKEGHREAKIENKLKRSKRRKQPSMLSSTSTGDGSSSGGGRSISSSVDQRPTRPLDIDPAQPQDAKDNIKYMKHLGFDSPLVDSDQSPEDGQGWIYLNLLMNMAQLHTLNVTPAFVRTAISAYSNHFEISEDGRSVRWKGGDEPSAFIMDSPMVRDDVGQSPDFKREPPAQRNARTVATQRSVAQTQRSSNRAAKASGYTTLGGGWRTERDRTEDSFYYSPMFWHGNESDSYNDLSSSVPLYDSGEKSRTISSDSNVQSASRLSRKPTKRQKDTGTLIFYTAAKFYTDLSGDPFSMPSTIKYEKVWEQAMGDNPPLASPYESKGPLSSPSLVSPSENPLDRDSDEEMDGLEEMNTDDIEDTGEKDLIDLPVTGIGGVMPHDNFLIDVSVKHPSASVTATRETALKPSALPPPSYAYAHVSSCSDAEESDDDDEENMDEYASADILRSGIDDSAYVPPAFLNVYSSESTRLTTSPEEEEDDSSIDMLEYARRADPEDVAAREKEFEDDESEADQGRLPPGSVAATVGDVSNFLTSQEDGASYDGRMLRRQQSKARKEGREMGEENRQDKKEADGGVAQRVMKREGEAMGSPSKRREL